MKQRNASVDIFKGLLVIGMVYAHVIQFFNDFEQFPLGHKFSDYFNLITFSGFVFSFGYVSQLAYYTKPFRTVYPRMGMTVLKMLAAFYVSGAYYRVFIDSRPLSWEATLKPIVLLNDMPGWSEFLASFAMITLAGIVLFHPLNWLLQRKLAFWIVTPLLLLTTFIPYESVTVMQLGLLIGTTKFASFPVAQYFAFYLVGMYFAKHQIVWNWKALVISLALSGGFAYYLAAHGGHLPSRFPPSWQWIVGPAAVLYGYYLVSYLLAKAPIVRDVLQTIGRSALFYLLVSNIFIFTLKSKYYSLGYNLWDCFVLTVALLAGTAFLVSIIVKLPKPLKAAAASAADKPVSQSGLPG